jgi:D-alanyl-D-alanine carboxypeptidase
MSFKTILSRKRNWPALELVPIILTLFLFLTFSCSERIDSQDQDLSDLQQLFQEKLQEIRDEFDIPGITASFILPDDRVASVAVGYSDVEEHIAMKPGDRMPSGSTGKTFVSALAILLAQEGILSLDDKAEKWLGDRDWFDRLPNARDLTIRILLRHQSGIIEPYNVQETSEQIFGRLSANRQMDIPPEEIIAYVLDRDPLFEAGKGFHYSDSNYLIVGLIIEEATQSTYYQELERRILTPHGLTDTIAQDRQVLPGLIPGYTNFLGIFGDEAVKTVTEGKMIYNPKFEWTGGGIITTPADLVRWAKLLYEEKLSSKPYLEELLAHDPSVSNYGLGVFVHETELGPVYGHRGIMPGYLTVMSYFADHQIAVAAQFNRDHDIGDLLEHARSLASVIVNQSLDENESE